MIDAPHEHDNVVGLDASWFHRHPEREYRLRAATRAEIEAAGIASMPQVTTVRTVVRRSDGATSLAIESVDRPFVDHDVALAALFEVLGSPASKR